MAEGTHLTGPAAVTQLALGAAREWAASAIRVADEIEAEGFEAAQKGAIFDMITPADVANRALPAQRGGSTFSGP